MDRVDFHDLLREKDALSKAKLTSIMNEAIASDDKENTLSILSDIPLDDEFFDFLMGFPEAKLPLSFNLHLNASRIEKLSDTNDIKILSSLTHYIHTSKEVLYKTAKRNVSESVIIRILEHWNMDDADMIRDLSLRYAPFNRLSPKIAAALASNFHTPRDIIEPLLKDFDDETLRYLLCNPHVTAQEGRAVLDKVAENREHRFSTTSNLQNCIIMGLDSDVSIVQVEDIYELINLNAYPDFTDVLKMVILHDNGANGWTKRLFAHLGIDVELSSGDSMLSRDMVANILGWDEK
jgi:hypothetical protein